VNSSWLFWLELDVIDFSSAAGGGKSPFTSAEPLRICFVPTVGSKPSLKMILSAYAGRQLVLAFQFGLRTRMIWRPGVYPVSLPAALFWIMYGPVATWWLPYDELVPLSNFLAYSAGTGAVSGSWSAPTKTPLGFDSLNTIVYLSGVWMPEMLGTVFVDFVGAPSITPKYAPA